MDLDLSTNVSVPTSRRPIYKGEIWYFSNKFWDYCEGNGVYIFVVFYECHFLLAEAYGVLSFTDFVELF